MLHILLANSNHIINILINQTFKIGGVFCRVSILHPMHFFLEMFISIKCVPHKKYQYYFIFVINMD